MKRRLLVVSLIVGFGLAAPDARAQSKPAQSKPAAPAQPRPGAAAASTGPVIVLETAKGVIEFETYPQEAPKTVARIIELIKKNFYNGLRFHRVDPGFVIQVGDPKSRDMSLRDYWGGTGSGTPLGVSEISKKRLHVKGAVAMAHSGSAKDADSQFYITLRAAPELNGKYTVFGRVIKGQDVVAQIKRTDVLKKASVRE